MRSPIRVEHLSLRSTSPPGPSFALRTDSKGLGLTIVQDLHTAVIVGLGKPMHF